MSSKWLQQQHFLMFIILIIEMFAATNALDLPPHLKAQAKKLHDRCQKETGVSEDLILQSHGGHMPDDGALKCYIHCLFNIIGLIDEKQDIHLEYINDVMPEEVHGIVDNLVQKCGTQRGADGCDTAFQTVQCYFQADLKTLQALIDFVFV